MWSFAALVCHPSIRDGSIWRIKVYEGAQFSRQGLNEEVSVRPWMGYECFHLELGAISG